MDTSSGMTQGIPFGGIGIVWRKSIGTCIHIHKYNDSRVMAIYLMMAIERFLLSIYICRAMTGQRLA